MRTVRAGFWVAVFVVSGVIARANTEVVTAFPLWTATGLTVTMNQPLSFSVSGGPWDWGGGPVGADGSFEPGLAYDEWIQDSNHGELIGYVGVDPMNDRNQPGAAPANPGRFFVIGSAGGVLTMPAGGELWLGFNDDRQSDATGDNSGSFNVTFGAAGSVPDAGTTWPLLAGAVTLLGLFRPGSISGYRRWIGQLIGG